MCFNALENVFDGHHYHMTLDPSLKLYNNKKWTRVGFYFELNYIVIKNKPQVLKEIRVMY